VSNSLLAKDSLGWRVFRHKKYDLYNKPAFIAETFWPFFGETFWSLRHFGHLSHSCIKTHRNSVH